MMKKNYKIALLGAGFIAGKIAEVAAHHERLELYGVSSRRVENATAFAEKYKIPHVFETYDEMLKDDIVDLIYISTPTKLHYEHIKMCLLAGRNVICEKPFVETQKQALELQQLAKERKLLLMDALWTMYMPIMDHLSEFAGKIGKIIFSTASLGYPSVFKDNHGNLNTRYDLWDYEVYPLATTIYLRGEPLSICSKTKHKKDTVMKNRTFLKYKGSYSRIFSSLLHRSTYLLLMIGTKGMIISRKWWFGDFPVLVWEYPLRFRIVRFPHEINGYEYELNDAIKCMDSGLLESEVYPLSKTISLLKWAEQLDIYH